MPNSDYAVYALRYCQSSGSRAARFHRYADYGEPDGPVTMDFYFWLIRNDQRTILVDCGFSPDQTEFPEYSVETHPRELLARLGVTPGAVDHVVLSHMHFDHIGNIGLFPNATFSVAQAEYEFWTGPYAGKPYISRAGIRSEIDAVTRLLQEERLTLLQGRTEIAPGVVAEPFRGHTPGQLVTEIASSGGRVILASDAVHLYEEIEKDRPFSLFVDLEGMFRTYAALRELQVQTDVKLVAGHDGAVSTRFARAADNCFDLTRTAE